MTYSFDITCKDVEKYNLTDSGNPVDLLAVAAGYGEYDDRENFEAEDFAVEYAVNGYDYEAAFIDALNAASGDYQAVCDLLGDDAGNDSMAIAYKEYQKSDLLFGAWYALDRPSVFAIALNDWTAKVKDAANEYLNEPDILPKDLLKSIEKSVDDTRADDYRQWLNGDCRSWGGIFTESRRKLFKDWDVELSEAEQGGFRVEFDKADAVEFLNDWTEDTEPTAKKVKDAVLDFLASKAEAVRAKDKAERERYAAERKAEAERKAVLEARAKAVRLAKLLKMTK
jgi:hypothetical protein